MNEPNIKERLKPRDSDAVPEIVEERLNEAFRQIRLEAAARENGELPAAYTVGDPARSGRPKRMLRFSAVAAAALLLLGSALAGLSMLSPTFAQTLQQFPLLGTLYSDKGIEAAQSKGLVQSYPSNLDSEDVPFGVRSIIYDGTRVVFDIYRKKSEPGGPVYDAGGVKEFSLYYQGEEFTFSYGPGLDGSSVAVFDRIEEIDPPEKFNLTLEIETTKSQTPYQIQIPVELNTSNTVIEKPETPEELKKYGISVERITLTPITTQILYREPFGSGLSEVRLDQLIDEQDRDLLIVGGHSESLPENTDLLNAYIFEPLKEGAREITLRFDVSKEGKLIRKIDMTVPIPASESRAQPE